MDKIELKKVIFGLLFDYDLRCCVVSTFFYFSWLKEKYRNQLKIIQTQFSYESLGMKVKFETQINKIEIFY